MSLPLWDPIHLPPDFTLVDVNSFADEDERTEYQAAALDAWITENGLESGAVVVRDWNDEEGAFIVMDSDGNKIGVVFIMEPENV